MKKIGFVFICALYLGACKNSKPSTTGESENANYQRQPTILALEIQVEKTSEAGDFNVLHIHTDTLEQQVSPLPLNEDMPDIFKVEVLNASNKTVFGSQYKTSFNKVDTKEIANLKFFCTVTVDTEKAKVYYRVSEGVWKLVTTIDL